MMLSSKNRMKTNEEMLMCGYGRYGKNPDLIKAGNGME